MGRLVPWIPRPKLIPERDGMYGASGDTHLRMEVPGACRGPSFVQEALWRNGRIHIYRDLRAELLQLARVVTRDVAVRGPGARLVWAGWLEIPFIFFSLFLWDCAETNDHVYAC